MKNYLKCALTSAALLLVGCSPDQPTAPPGEVSPQMPPDTKTEAGNDNPFAEKKIVYPKADPLLGFVDARTRTSLNGDWQVIIDPMGVGDPGGLFGGFTKDRQQRSDMDLIEYNFRTAQTIRVPGDFNTQDERLFFYQGRVWYHRTFEVDPSTNMRRHLWFGGANFKTAVFLNGKDIGEHVGGYVPFSFDVTDAVQPGTNTLIVRADNRLAADTVPTARTDWWPYGGLIRDVALIETPAGFIRNAKIALTDLTDGTIKAAIETSGLSQGTEASIEIPELGISETTPVNELGRAQFVFAASPGLWSPDQPRLYDVMFKAGNDLLEDRVGFRTIETLGQQILLNGKPLKLKGISTHEEAIGRDGIAYSEADVRSLLTEAKSLNANFVRAAHYPYSRHMARAADELGLLLWEEIPVYWNIQWENNATLAIARDQMDRLVRRDWNRASVIVWSVANETPHSEARLAFLQTLIDDVKASDDTRLVSAALFGNPREELKEVVLHIAARGLERDVTPDTARAIFSGIITAAGDHAPNASDTFELTITDPLGERLDVVSYNEYFGWYYSALFARQLGIGEDVLRPIILEMMPDIRIGASVNKPLIISEFGAGAKKGFEGTGVWSEAYQARVYEAQIEMLRNSPQVQGMTPWILKDFRAMLRTLPGVQDYRNRKGLIDENGNRKEAFNVLQSFYDDEWKPEN